MNFFSRKRKHSADCKGTMNDTDDHHLLQFMKDMSRSRQGIAMLVVLFLVLVFSLHGGTSIMWAFLAGGAIAVAAYDKRQGQQTSTNEEGAATVAPTVATRTVQHVHDIAEARRGDTPSQKYTHIPDLYSVSRLEGKHTWLRDPQISSALDRLRPFTSHDGHRVRRVILLLGEFFRRYGRFLNRPFRVPHKSNEYSIMYDLHTKVLNSLHELYFTKPLHMCADLPHVTRTLQSHMSRMLRVLRHKYVSELRGVQNNSVPVAAAAVADTEHDMYI